MRRFRRFFAIVLSLSMVLTLFMPVSQAEAKGKKTDVGSVEEQADEQDAVRGTNAGSDEKSSAQDEYTRVSAPKEINDDGSTLDEIVTGIELVLKSEDAGLADGDGRLALAGNTGSLMNMRYYLYDDSKILLLYNIKMTYANGMTYEAPLLNAVRDKKVTYSTNQSYENPWKADGTNNKLTVTGGSVSTTEDVPVKKYFYEMYDGRPQLEEDKKTEISYRYSDANTGMCLFQPESDGTYYFYSLGAADTCARLYDEYGVSFAYDDDEYDDHNFLISAELEAGKTYVLETYVYGLNKDASYTVTVTKKDLGRPSLEGRDLSGKYINLALVVDTTSSMTGIINKVKNSLNEFVSTIAKTNATLRISLIDYKDIIEDGKNTTILHYSPSLSIWFENDDIEDLKKEIEALKASGGGDGPESAVDALANVIEPDVMTFNMAAAKFAFVVTDATFKEENLHGLGTPVSEDLPVSAKGNVNKGTAMKQLIHRLVEKGITTSVITSKKWYAAYEDYKNITSLTGGVRINVDDDFTKAMSRIAAQIVDETEDWEADPDIVPVIGIELGEDLSVPEGKIKNFRPTFNPSNASEQGVVWTVEDETIAKVSPKTTNGILVVQGIKGGTTKIIARSLDGGYVASFDLTVQKTVVTDNKMESCDIDSILDELEKPEPAEGEKPITDLVYYGDAEPTVGEEKQKGIYSKIIRTPKSISYVFDDEIGDLLYQWKFEGEGITDSDIAVDLDVAVDAADSRVEQAAIDRVGLDPYTVVDFSHDGELPGTATVTLKVGDRFEDGSYDLYYYNEATRELELCEDTVVTVSGDLAVFSISHCSSYVIGKKHIPPTPTPTEAPTPTPTVKPTEAPTPTPTVKPTEIPTPTPTVKPTEVPTPTPTVKPTEAPTPTPTVKPTEVPTPTPTEVPTPTPTVKPTEIPTPTPTVKPTAKPTETPASTVTPTETPRPTPAIRIPAKGTQLTDKKALYKITKAGQTGGTVTYVKPLNSKATVVSVPDTVTVGGITYKVTSIAPNAFKNCKNIKKLTIGKNITKIGAKAFYKCSRLAKILIKTQKLTMKKVGSKAFRDVYSKVSVNVPKGRLKAYKKLLRARGCGRKAKIK